jgi:hypothetical protein
VLFLDPFRLLAGHDQDVGVPGSAAVLPFLLEVAPDSSTIGRVELRKIANLQVHRIPLTDPAKGVTLLVSGVFFLVDRFSWH